MLALASTCAVLIVEDHPDTAGMIRWYLERQGLDVEMVGGGREAVEFLERGGRPACVLLDLMMPDIGGLELLRRMKGRADWADIHVFMYSASYDWHDQREAEELGAEAWFVKGVTPLADILARVMARCVATE